MLAPLAAACSTNACARFRFWSGALAEWSGGSGLNWTRAKRTGRGVEFDMVRGEGKKRGAGKIL